MFTSDLTACTPVSLPRYNPYCTNTSDDSDTRFHTPTAEALARIQDLLPPSRLATANASTTRPDSGSEVAPGTAEGAAGAGLSMSPQPSGVLLQTGVQVLQIRHASVGGVSERGGSVASAGGAAVVPPMMAAGEAENLVQEELRAMAVAC
jgi:hypothetical protein